MCGVAQLDRTAVATCTQQQYFRSPHAVLMARHGRSQITAATVGLDGESLPALVADPAVVALLQVRGGTVLDDNRSFAP